MPKKKNKQTLVLLDSHAIIHRAYHALPDFASSKGEATGGLYGLATMLMGIIKELKPDYIVATYDLPEPTYRHEIYQDYKAGRGEADDALVEQLERSRDIFEAFSIPMYDKPGFEADDMLGTIVELTKKKKDLEIIIASGDMDTLQLVEEGRVRVYTLKKGIKDTIIYDEKAVLERFGFEPEKLIDYKGLRGDPSDNIIGVKGIGEKTATTLIQEFGTIEAMYQKLKKDEASFEKAGIKPRIVNLLKEHEEEAFFSKELATIRRDAPITFTLPKKIWRESIDLDTIDALFKELEFRTLGGRLRTVLGIEPEKEAVVSDASTEDTLFGKKVNEKKLQEAAIALWVLDSNVTNPTLDDVLTHTEEKELDTAHTKLFKELEEKKLVDLYNTFEKPLIPILKKMRTTGIKIDLGYFLKLSKEYHKKAQELEKGIYKHAGHEFNINSPKQLGEVLFTELGLQSRKKTSGGSLSTKESVLQTLKDKHDIIPLILEYREYAKLIGTYIDAIPKLVDPKDGRLHGTFIQTGTTTGRMASADPNLQNIPNSKEHGKRIRKGFVAEKGFKLVAIDYSQIELRIAAFLSKDEKLVEVFRNGEDVHTAVAKEVFGVEADAVTKDMRRQAKVINFGILYGMGVNALKDALGTDRKEAQKFYNEYFEQFKTLAKYLDDVKLDAHRKGYTETFFGRRRYFEGLNSHLPFIRAQAERMAINAPIQGTGADIVKKAMIDIDAYIKKNKLENDVRMLLQVHDELVFEIRESHVQDMIPNIQKLMESVINPKQSEGITCTTDASVGESWGEMGLFEM